MVVYAGDQHGRFRFSLLVTVGVIIWPLKAGYDRPIQFLYTLEVTGGYQSGDELSLYAGIVLGVPFCCITRQFTCRR